jgi:sodium transport system ATP-binding protein
MSATVVVRGLTKTFFDEGRGEVRAVDGIDFECSQGEIFGLLGANGAGKTTTLRMLATILAPSGGSASVLGNDVAAAPEAVRRSLGFFSATTALYPRLTARETLEFFARINRYPAERVAARVAALIARFGLADYADARVDKLSTGMKQKVSIARTIIHDPPVLIFDEPTSGLDVLVARAVLRAIMALRAQGKCIIFSTHIMREVEKLCDRIAIIHKGRILAAGTLAELENLHDEPDMEELFFDLISRYEERLNVPQA